MRSLHPLPAACAGLLLISGIVLVPASVASAVSASLLPVQLNALDETVVGILSGSEDPAPGDEEADPSTPETPSSTETPVDESDSGTPTTTPTETTVEQPPAPVTPAAPEQATDSGAAVSGGATSSTPSRSTRSSSSTSPAAPAAVVPSPSPTQLATLPLPSPTAEAATTAGAGVGGLGVDPNVRPAAPVTPQPSQTNPIALALIALVLLGGLTALLLQLRAMRVGRPAPAGALPAASASVIGTPTEVGAETDAAARLRILTAPTPVVTTPRNAPKEDDYVSQMESYFADAEADSRRAS